MCIRDRYGSVAQAGLMASLLAQEGYIGEHEVLDSIPGFFEAQGYMGAYRELLDCASEKWWIMDTALKPYPSCRFTHAAIDAVLDFQKKHEVSIEDIDSIVIRLNPIAYSTRFFREPATSIAQDHRAPLHGAFNIPYITALALLGHRRGPDWYDPSVLNPSLFHNIRRPRAGQCGYRGAPCHLKKTKDKKLIESHR